MARYVRIQAAAWFTLGQRWAWPRHALSTYVGLTIPQTVGSIPGRGSCRGRRPVVEPGLQ